MRSTLSFLASLLILATPSMAQDAAEADAQITVRVQVRERTEIDGRPHSSLVDPFRGGQTLSQEVDPTLSYKYDRSLDMATGASLFLPHEAMKRAKGEDLAFWLYLMFIAGL